MAKKLTNPHSGTIIEVKKGRTKEEVEADRLKDNGVSMDDIFYQTDFELKVGSETFSIKRKNVIDGYPVQKKINALLQRIVKTLGDDQLKNIIESFKDVKSGSLNFNVPSLIKYFTENYSVLSDNLDEIVNIFIEEYISEEEKVKIDLIPMEDWDDCFNQIIAVVFPFFLRPIKRALKIMNSLPH